MVLGITPNTKFVYSLRHPFEGVFFYVTEVVPEGEPLKLQYPRGNRSQLRRPLFPLGLPFIGHAKILCLKLSFYLKK